MSPRASTKTKKKETRVKLNLQGDIYSYTYWKWHYEDDPVNNADLFIKSLLGVVIQCLIIFYRFNEVIAMPGEVHIGEPYMNSVRIACAFFMHL